METGKNKALLQDAVNLITHSKTRANPESNVALMTLSDLAVLVTLTTDTGKILAKLHQVRGLVIHGLNNCLNQCCGSRAGSGNKLMSRIRIRNYHWGSGLLKNKSSDKNTIFNIKSSISAQK